MYFTLSKDTELKVMQYLRSRRLRHYKGLLIGVEWR